MDRPDIAAPAALDRFAAYLAAPESTGADLLLVVAHPDDETVGFGGHLAALPSTTIVHITDGAPRDLRDATEHGFPTATDYAAARRRELVAALDVATVPLANVLDFGITDQRAGYQLTALAHRLAALFDQRRPYAVLTHPFEGGHPDHDATAFAVAAACRLLASRGRTPPQVIEMASYHLGEAGTVYQGFSPVIPAAEIEVALGDDAISRKRQMLACHATQERTLAPFGSAVERFRIAPPYDFAKLPNGGRLQYEAWDLGLTGDEWLRLAGAALKQLELPA